MAHANPWYIITGEEIEEIRDQLRTIRAGSYGSGTDRVQEIDDLLRTVRDRRP